MKSFEELQAQLGQVLALNRQARGAPHVLVVLPSFSVGESLLSHYAARISALEHRYLVAHFLLHRVAACEMAFVTCEEPGEEVLGYYASLVPAGSRASVRTRFRTVVVPDRTPRSVAAKLLDRPDLLDALRASFDDRPVFIEPWNVTEHEVQVALQLEAPLNGTSPDLWPLGYKSAGRQLLVEAGVPTPFGREHVHTVEDVVEAIAAVRSEHPAAPAVVIKHDDSGAGDGNAVIELHHLAGDPAADERVRARLGALPDWYLRDLGLGAVVEELITGARFSSPSVQVDISPYGDVVVLATHEQVLGGETGQVYTGCRFPADPPYAAQLASYGRATGEQLARRGAIGRFSVDFAAACDATGRWDLFALEINLRKGGTTHPFAVLRTLVPGRYDTESGQWLALAGDCRAYWSTDNLVDEAWLGLPPAAVIRSVANAGLQFDYRTGTGVVLHMLSCLAIDGRFGLTAIGRSPEHAAELFEHTKSAVNRARFQR
ncbi:MAG: peptide ligase PGM1-related protein [Actinomycetota bacterium]|nr:peptide ligase PGM1-related protein [Actinomycetota bacterium]